MNSTLIAIAAFVILAGCDQKPVPIEKVVPPPPVKPAKSKDLVLSAQAVGPVMFGALLSQVEASLGQAIRIDEVDNPECSFVSFKALPKVRFMVEKGVITRADVPQEIANTSGVRVGDTVASLKQKHADVQVKPHDHITGGQQLTLKGTGGTALVMESNGTNITSVRAGLESSVANAGGCS